MTSHAPRARYAARLILPPVATAVAFPHAVSAVVDVDSFAGVTELMVVGAAAAAMVAMRAYPATGEPDVHDRQLDLIAGLPLLVSRVVSC